MRGFGWVIVLLVALGVATTLGWLPPLATPTQIAQVITAGVAVFLAWRSVTQDDAPLRVVRVDVKAQHGPDEHLNVGVWIRVSLFNPSGRGNVVRSVTIYMHDRSEHTRLQTTDWRNDPTKLEHRGLAGYVQQPRTVVDFPEKVEWELPRAIQRVELVDLPMGVRRFDTIAFDLLARGHAAYATSWPGGYLVDIWDARNRRSTGRSYAFAHRVYWWTRFVPGRWLQAFANRESRDRR